MGQNTQETVRLLKTSLIRKATQHNIVHRTRTRRYLNCVSKAQHLYLALASFPLTMSVETLIAQTTHQRYTIAVSIYSLNKQQV